MARAAPSWWIVPCIGTLLAGSRGALAGGSASVRLPDPCPQCILSAPSGSDPRPLLVVLHGDHERAAAIYDAWEPAAAARRIVVFAPTCPKGAGCASESWWRWNGDPAWLFDQIRSIDVLRPLDPARAWIVGWSGGASYLGYRTQEFERVFAAIVIHGGGIAPAIADCPERRAAVYFLVGDANPLHGLAVRLREHYEACANDVTWTLLAGYDHRAEWGALAKRREAMLDWLATKRRVAAAAPAAGASDAVPGALSVAGPGASEAAPAAVPGAVSAVAASDTVGGARSGAALVSDATPAGRPAPARTSAARRVSCAETLPGAGASHSAALGLLVLAAVSWRRRPRLAGRRAQRSRGCDPSTR